MSQLPEILHILRSISPRREFSSASKMRILNTPRLPRTEKKAGIFTMLFSIASSNAAMSASLLLVICLSGTLYMRSRSPLLAAKQSLKNMEGEEFAIQIKLSELAAYEESAYKTQLVRHNGQGAILPQRELMSEDPALAEKPPINHDIDKALELML